MTILKNDWEPVLKGEFCKPYYQSLRKFLIEEYRSRTIYPDMHDIFNALHFTTYEKLKVVIIGQDPYHGAGQAHGLSFSVKPGIKPPPSLINIFKELHEDIGCKVPNNGCLIPWAKEGVLLLNTVLTVGQGQANSHRGRGWEIFTNQVIATVNQRKRPAVFILWGKHAQEKRVLITSPQHYVIFSPHPSPFSASRGFFGSKPFSRANNFLLKTGQTSVNWQLPDV